MNLASVHMARPALDHELTLSNSSRPPPPSMPPITLLMGPVIWEGKQELEKREKLSGENTFSLLLFFVIVNAIIQSLELKLLSQVQTEQ